MNMIKINRIIIKLFTVENVFVFSILSKISVSVISNKTIESFIKIFKIMQLNNVKVITANDSKQIINFKFY